MPLLQAVGGADVAGREIAKAYLAFEGGAKRLGQPLADDKLVILASSEAVVAAMETEWPLDRGAWVSSARLLGCDATGRGTRGVDAWCQCCRRSMKTLPPRIM